MVAKLIVHGATREEALARMDAALAQTHIVGLATNVQFLRHVVRTPSFTQAQLDTALIPREAALLFNCEDVGLPLAAASTVAHIVLQEQRLAARTDAQGWTDPWAQRDGWLSHGVSRRSFALDFKGEAHTAVLTRLRSGGLQLALGGQVHSLQLATQAGQGGTGAIDITLNDKRVVLQVYRAGDVLHIFALQGATQIAVVDALAHAGDTQAEGGRLTAPMPGKVVSFSVKAGDAVKKGQALAVMEAMKMEHTIAAPADGTVCELLFAPGDQVTEGAELLRLEAA
jgi:3-methylcrotonyl-CoA carboxylase alpha subunit